MSRNDWRPTATRDRLALRARLLARTRRFFERRGVLEVETPALAAAPVTDPHLASLPVDAAGLGGRRLHLQTSPEFAMKRLLAAGSGPVYQLARAFRDGESGRRHNPEFTLLEWYRPGFDHLRLMDEVEALVRAVLAGTVGEPDPTPAERTTFRDAFERHAGVDPDDASTDELATAARAAGLEADLGDDREGWIDLLLATVIEPRLGRHGFLEPDSPKDTSPKNTSPENTSPENTSPENTAPRLVFIHDWPPQRAALARVRPGDPPRAERFELFVRRADGVVLELANGFHELTDPVEQRRRFEADRAERRRRGLPDVPVDERLLAALEAGLPDCAGVALGFDRLAMLAAGVDDIAEVIAFPLDRA